MSQLFARLPAPSARRYAPKQLDCANLNQLKKLYEELLNRPLSAVSSVASWLGDLRELSVVFNEYDAMAYIRKSVDTRDKKAQAAYLHLVQKIHPALAPDRDKLNKKLLEHPLRRKFPKRWSLMLRSRQNAVRLFREKNILLERQIDETVLQYSQLMGGLEVVFEKKKQTLTQMGVYLERTDRDLRHRAWESAVRRRFLTRERVDTIYDRLVQLRTRVARNAGFKNFRDFCHRRYDRFDYTPRECFMFHNSVEEVVMPAIRRLRERRAREMELEVLKPWDLAVDPIGRPPLKPFQNGNELARLSSRVFGRMDRQLGRQFRMLINCGVLDLDNRPGKEPGGYQHTLPERQLPFIFMNAVGRDTDVRTLLHEGGHAFHMLAAKDEPILDYRHAPAEFCEVASMSMELLANRHAEIFYRKPDDRKRSTRVLLEGTLDILPWVATIDAFQHWVYTHPGHSRAERRVAWMRLRKQFGDGTDWSGYRPYEEVLWHHQLHLFGVPFYYIEYGIAQLGALMVWHRSLKNTAAALRSYKQALQLGGSVGLKSLFRAVGGRLDFSVRNMKPLVEAVMTHLGF